jgi:hypothetical protein
MRGMRCMEVKARCLDRIRLYTCALKCQAMDFPISGLGGAGGPALATDYKLIRHSRPRAYSPLGPGCALRLFPGVLTDLFAEVRNLVSDVGSHFFTTGRCD